MNIRSRIPSVNLRERSLASGRRTLFLDITVDGKRVRESLNLFLEPGTGKMVKEKNKETMLVAQAMADKRQEEIRESASGLTLTDGGDRLFFDYFEECMSKRNEGTQESWTCALIYLKQYEPNAKLTLGRITKQWVEGFQKHLLNSNLKRNSARELCQKLYACLNEAVREGILARGPHKMVPQIRAEETERAYLTQDELKRLMETDIPMYKQDRRSRPDVFKRAFIFSCMTGLRISDVSKLTWNDVTTSPNGHTRIIFRQKKTKGVNYLDINSVAVAQLGERTDDGKPIFPVNSSIAEAIFPKWTQAAGIDKHLSFHCARHTNAVLLLESGTDIFTVQKMLGHANIASTMVYAKVIDSTKTKAADRLAAMF